MTDYGVKWLTNSKAYYYSNVQAVSTEDNKIVVLFEKTRIKDYKYMGVFYMVLDSYGNIIQKMARYSQTAHLNPYETPIISNGTIYWTANKVYQPNKKNYMYTFGLKLKKTQ